MARSHVFCNAQRLEQHGQVALGPMVTAWYTLSGRDGLWRRWPGEPFNGAHVVVSIREVGHLKRDIYIHQVQFFEWDVMGTKEESWWDRFARLTPELAKLGVTQVWLPRTRKILSAFLVSFY